MLTEKEIEIIARKVFLQGTKAVPIWAMKDMARDVHQFAAAIAKRLSEGVVWSDEAEISHDYEDDPFSDVPCTMISFMKTPGSLYLADEHYGEDGQLIEVIVRIVEETKDESRGF